MTRKYKSPGPKYGLPNAIGLHNVDLRLKWAPAFSLGQKLQPQPTTKTPGPKYALSTLTRHGPTTVNGISLAAKDHVRRTQRGPGPSAYDVVPCLPLTRPKMPMYSMGTKSARGKTGRTPAPNAYPMAATIGNQLPHLPSAPMYSISARYEEPLHSGKQRCTPGPARYPAVSIGVTKAQTPRPVILGRLDPTYRTATPAPNKYLPGAGGLRFVNAPQFSIAARIREQADPFYTAADKVPDWY